VHSAPRQLLVCVLTATLTAVAGCGDSGPPPAPGGRSSAPAASASSGAPGFFGGTDLAWLEINIAMDEQLMPLLDLVTARSGSADVKSLAVEVQAFHEQELTTLRRLHDLAKLPAENPHKGMPMPGMVTAEQVTEAAAAKGTGFDALLLTRLREHMEQGVHLADSELKAGIEPQSLALARQVLRNRDTYLPRVIGLKK